MAGGIGTDIYGGLVVRTVGISVTRGCYYSGVIDHHGGVVSQLDPRRPARRGGVGVRIVVTVGVGILGVRCRTGGDTAAVVHGYEIPAAAYVYAGGSGIGCNIGGGVPVTRPAVAARIAVAAGFGDDLYGSGIAYLRIPVTQEDAVGVGIGVGAHLCIGVVVGIRGGTSPVPVHDVGCSYLYRAGVVDRMAAVSRPDAHRRGDGGHPGVGVGAAGGGSGMGSAVDVRVEGNLDGPVVGDRRLSVAGRDPVSRDVGLDPVIPVPADHRVLVPVQAQPGIESGIDADRGSRLVVDGAAARIPHQDSRGAHRGIQGHVHLAVAVPAAVSPAAGSVERNGFHVDAPGVVYGNGAASPTLDSLCLGRDHRVHLRPGVVHRIGDRIVVRVGRGANLDIPAVRDARVAGSGGDPLGRGRDGRLGLALGVPEIRFRGYSRVCGGLGDRADGAFVGDALGAVSQLDAVGRAGC